MKSVIVLFVSLMTTAAFAGGDATVECNGQYNGKKITLIEDVHLDPENGAWTQPVITIAVNDQELIRFETNEIVEGMRQVGGKQGLILDAASAKNAQGALSLFYPEQDPDSQVTYVTVSLKLKRANVNGYAILRNIELACQ